jgi:hypothetical protein
MAEKSISDQIVDEFIESIEKSKIIYGDRLAKLKTVLNSDKPKKNEILKALKEKEKNENP